MKELIEKINNELSVLGIYEKSMRSLPPVVNRINITLNIAKLALFDRQQLTKEDLKWCEYYAQYNHMFDSKEMEKLGELYFELIERMKREFFSQIKS